MTPNELQALREAYDREQRIEIVYPGHRKETLPRVVRFVRTVETGWGYIPYTWLNGADPADVVREQVDYFRELNMPFEWTVCEHDSSPGLKEALLDCGFEPDLSPGDPGAVLVLDLQAVPASLATPLREVRHITQPERLADVIRVTEQVWGGNLTSWLQPRLRAHLAIPGYLSVYATYEQDEPVCAGWTYYPAGSSFAGLFGGSTVSAYRRRGHYTALLAARVQEAVRRGRRYMLICAGLESRPVVEKNGFRLLTYSCSYEWKPVSPGAE